jgi:hypothetical protein
VLTPFPHTRSRDDLVKEGRILTSDWDLYTADNVVFQPRHMTPDRLLELYRYAWDTFYRDEPQTHKMYKLCSRWWARKWPTAPSSPAAKNSPAPASAARRRCAGTRPCPRRP